MKPKSNETYIVRIVTLPVLIGDGTIKITCKKNTYSSTLSIETDPFAAVQLSNNIFVHEDVYRTESRL